MPSEVLPISSRKMRPPVRELEAARLLAVGPGEGALLVPEELATRRASRGAPRS